MWKEYYDYKKKHFSRVCVFDGKKYAYNRLLILSGQLLRCLVLMPEQPQTNIQYLLQQCSSKAT